METKNIMQIMIVALVGAIILVGFVPVIGATQENVGEPAEVINEKYAGVNYLYSIWDGSDMTFNYTSTDDSATYTINGETFTLGSSEQRIIIASNDFACRSGGNQVINVLNSQYVSVTTQFNNTDFSFVIVDKEYTLTLGSNEYTGTVDWLVYANDNGTSGLVQIKNYTSPFYTSNTNDIIVLGNIYTTGDNDTFYSYYDGKLTVNETYADESSVSITKTLVDGYTDIYNTTITVTVGDETFNPFFILAPEKVSGHSATGAMYDVYGLIPLIVAVGLLMFVITAILIRRV